MARSSQMTELRGEVWYSGLLETSEGKGTRGQSLSAGAESRLGERGAPPGAGSVVSS